MSWDFCRLVEMLGQYNMLMWLLVWMLVAYSVWKQTQWNQNGSDYYFGGYRGSRNHPIPRRSSGLCPRCSKGASLHGQETVYHLFIMSWETGEEVKPQLHEFKKDALFVENWDVFTETAGFPWFCPLEAENLATSFRKLSLEPVSVSKKSGNIAIGYSAPWLARVLRSIDSLKCVTK